MANPRRAAGTRVLFSKYSGSDIQLDVEEQLIVRGYSPKFVRGAQIVERNRNGKRNSPPAWPLALRADLGEELKELARSRLQKFMALLPRVLIEDDPDAVHDFRVWSRRLQQVVATLSPAPLPPVGRKIVRTLRRARRRLSSGWRDCDVLIDLAESKARRIRIRGEKRAWDRIRDWVLRERKRQMHRARRKLADCELLRLPQRVRKLTRACIKQIEEQDADLAAVLASSVGRSYEQWRQALSSACDSLDLSDIHAFRIECKRLRYRIELARDLGDGGAEAVLASLKELQDELGIWHDHIDLAELAAKALANSQFMLVQPRVATAVLQMLAKMRPTMNAFVSCSSTHIKMSTGRGSTFGWRDILSRRQ